MDDNAKFGDFSGAVDSDGKDNKPNSENKLSDEEIQIERHNYLKAIQEEFEAKQEKEVTNDSRVETARELFKENSMLAATQIVWLSINGQNDATKLAAAKFIYLQAQEEVTGGDEMEKLFEKLAKAGV